MSLRARRRKLLALGLAAGAFAVVLALSFSPGIEHVLPWLREHWLNAVAVTALGTMLLTAATLGVPFMVRRLDRTNRQAADRAARERESMLQRVRYKWITQVLAPSLADAAQLALGLQRRPDALHLGGRVIRRPGQPPAPVPDGTSITEIFGEVSGGLLILGTPGAGKTTLLLRLADGLLHGADRDPGRPIPVVFNLASWAAEGQPLATWLAEELATSYTVPRRTASAWVAQDALALLLDGLDEVVEGRRDACAEAINVYRRDHGLVPIAVCSRTEEFEDLAVSLGLDEAVELLPPTDAQIDHYLSHLEATGTTLGDVRATLATDQDLQELLRSPLMLHVITLAYHGQPAPALHEPGSVEQRSKRLWQAYIERMFEQRPLDPECGYTPQRAAEWLGWLALRMQDRDQAEFRLGRLDSKWVPAASGQNDPPYRDWLEDIAYNAVQLDDVLQVSWKGLVGGLCLGLVLFTCWGMLLELIAWLFSRARLPLLSWLPVFTPAWLGSGLAVALALGVVGGLGLGLYEGLNADLDKEPTSPSEGVRRATKYGLVAGLTTGLAAGLGTGLATGIAFGLATGLCAGLAVGMVAALVAGLICGGAASLHHYVIRTQLTRAGVAPRQYESFLEAMAERLLLRRSGSAYLFIHRLLREYLAARLNDKDHDNGLVSEQHKPLRRVWRLHFLRRRWSHRKHAARGLRLWRLFK
jgi:hypothetical protein